MEYQIITFRWNFTTEKLLPLKERELLWKREEKKMSILRDETGAVAIVGSDLCISNHVFCPVFHNDDGKYLLSTGTELMIL